MTGTSELQLFGIIGHPVGHSLSPLMHNTAFESLGMYASMQAFDIEPGKLKDALQGFITMKFGGINVTLPHKETIIPLLDEIDEEAGIIGAVNTVRFSDGHLVGSNTDAYGFLQMLDPMRSTINGGRFVVLGAGGAARAVVYVLMKHFQTTQIVVASRSGTHAKDLLEHFKGVNQANLSACSLADSQLTRVLRISDVIINATPVGMFPNSELMPLGGLVFRSGQVVVDLIYRPLETKFLRQARTDGATTINGLEMLIQQGARAFNFWTARSMPIDTVRGVLIAKLEQESATRP